MVRVDAMSSAGALLALLVAKTRFAAGADADADAFSVQQTRRVLTTSTSSIACPAEGQACFADAGCAACTEAYLDSIDSCAASATAGTCDELQDIVCCASSGCEGDAVFAAIIECSIPEVGCVIDVASCALRGGGAVSDSTTTTLDDTTSPSTTDRAVPTPTTDSATTATTGADDGGVSVISDLACEAEHEACTADEDCLSCLLEIDASVEAVEAACHPPGFDEDTATCSEREEPACCAIDEGPVCATELGDTLVALLDCTWEAIGCDFRIAECASGAATATTTDSADDEADAVDAEEDAEDTDATGDTDSDSATQPAAATRGAAAVFVAAAVSLAFMNV